MTSAEFKRAFAIASDPTVQLEHIDCDVLIGCATMGFRPVTATVHQVAKFIRYQAFQFNGDWDADELSRLRIIFRFTVTMVG